METKGTYMFGFLRIFEKINAGLIQLGDDQCILNKICHIFLYFLAETSPSHEKSQTHTEFWTIDLCVREWLALLSNINKTA
jgi:hypothetical protein